VKRVDLIRELEKAGCVLLRHGAKHDIFHQPASGMSQPVPRHRDISEVLARKIIKDLAKPAGH
jgi:predicted RNA binding protein YcfA (HicA-like mRNA interferase family)